MFYDYRGFRAWFVLIVFIPAHCHSLVFRFLVGLQINRVNVTINAIND